MPSKTFYLPVPTTAMHSYVSGFRSIVITTTDGLKPSSSSQTTNTIYCSKFSGSSNIDWNNTYITAYDGLPQAEMYKPANLKTFPLRTIQYDPRYLTQDADGESWTITKDINFSATIGSLSTSQSYFEVQSSGLFRYTKEQTEGWTNWGSNGNGVTLDITEWNSAKFRTQSNLDSWLITSGNARNVSLYGLTTSASIGSRITNELVFGGTHEKWNFFASGWGCKYAMQVSISNQTFDQFGIFLNTTSATQSGTVIVEFHSVGVETYKTNLNRTAELSMSLSLGSDQFIGKKQSNAAYASFFDLPSAVTLNGTYTIVVRSTGMTPTNTMKIVSAVSTGTQTWTWDSSSPANSSYYDNKSIPFILATKSVGNRAPSNINLSASSIQENNAVNAVIGALSAIDPDTGDTSFTFAISGGADAASFNISGNSLRASEAFNYEAKSSYSVDITATDAGGLSYTKSFSISITNDVSDDSITVPSLTVLTSGRVFVISASNPTSIPFLLNGSALPIGSVVRWTGNNNQKFLKKSGSSTLFAAILLSVPAEWNWDADGVNAWEALKNI